MIRPNGSKRQILAQWQRSARKKRLNSHHFRLESWEYLEAQIVVEVSITQITQKLGELGTTLDDLAKQTPFDASRFELAFKKGISEDLLQPVAEFVDAYNPIPEEVAHYLTQEIYPLKVVLDTAQDLNVLPPQLDHYNGDTSIAGLVRVGDKSLREQLAFFLDTSTLAGKIGDAV